MHMDLLSIADAAGHLGVSPRRVRSMLADGQLRGERIGGTWLVDPSSIPATPRRAGQPLSPRMAWAFVEVADGRRPEDVSASELWRLRSRWDKLLTEQDPVASLRSLLARRARREVLAAPDPVGVLSDARVAASGRSDRRSGMADSRLAEGYVSTRDVDAVTFDHLLVPARLGESSNAILYVCDSRPRSPVPWLLVAADLADLGPREAQQAMVLIRERGRPANRERQA